MRWSLEVDLEIEWKHYFMCIFIYSDIGLGIFKAQTISDIKKHMKPVYATIPFISKQY